MQTVDNISSESLAHGLTASAQCPLVDGANAILVHTWTLILPYPQHMDNNTMKPCVPACCTWHFPKKAQEL